jgi:hypothetical protein
MANEDLGVADLASLLGQGWSSDGRRKECLKRAELCRSGTAVRRQDSSAFTGDLLCPLYVDSGRPECVDPGHVRSGPKFASGPT